MRQMRDAVGLQMEIGIECHFRWNRASMERIARALEPYNILFLEDVLPAVTRMRSSCSASVQRSPLSARSC